MVLGENGMSLEKRAGAMGGKLPETETMSPFWTHQQKAEENKNSWVGDPQAVDVGL